MAKQQPTGAMVVAEARSLEGVPYVYGGTDPRTGLDCSGLVLVCANRVGIMSCPRTSEDQFTWGIPIDQPEPGCLVFFVGAEIDPPPGHVGIVVAPGRMIDAPHTGTVVQEQAFGTNGAGVNKFMGYRRIPFTKTSPNANLSTEPGPVNEVAAGFATALVSAIIVVLVFILVVAALVALVGAGVIFG